MLRMLSDYTQNMEELVRDRESELVIEQRQVEDMLFKILPRFVIIIIINLFIKNTKQYIAL